MKNQANHSWDKFRVPFIQETIRRHFQRTYTGYPESSLRKMVEQLLYSSTATEEDKKSSNSSDNKNVKEQTSSQRERDEKWAEWVFTIYIHINIFDIFFFFSSIVAIHLGHEQ